MTAQICLLGDSHLAAPRAAAADPANLPAAADLHFFGAPNNMMEDLAVEKTCLVPTTDATRFSLNRFGGVSQIDLAAYDIFVLVGLQLNVFWATALCRRYRLRGQKGWRHHDPKRPLLSQQLAQATLSGRLLSTRSLRIAALIRQVSDRPIWFVPEPRPGQTILAPGLRFPAFHKLLAHGDGPHTSWLYEQTANACLPGRYLPQPPQTICDGIFTHADFRQAATQLPRAGKAADSYPEGDFLHANDRYGALVLQQIGNALISGQGAPFPPNEACATTAP